MKRKYSKWLLLPLAASLLLPSAVSAADAPSTVKTSADFKDLSGLDAALKAKIDALLAKGVFDGVGNDTFDITANMTRAQFAKVVSKVFDLNVDPSATSSSFSDVSTSDWATPFIEAAKKAGIIDGMGDGTFNPSANVTMGQLATGLVKGLGEKPSTTGTPWYADAISKAIDKNILPDGTDGSKLATRADLVVGSYGAYEKQQDSLKLSLMDAKATGAQKISVSFNKQADSSIKLSVTKDGKTVSAQAVSDGSKGYVLNFSEKLTAGKYTVSAISSDQALDVSSASVDVQDEQIVKLEFTNASDTIASSKQAAVPFKATNQYGEVVQLTAATLKVTTNAGGAVLNEAQQASVLDTTSFELNAPVSITISVVNSNVSATKIFRVGSSALVSKISDVTLRNASGQAVSQAVDPGSYHLNFNLYDQYGSLMQSASLLGTPVSVSSSNSGVVSVGSIGAATTGEPGSFSLPLSVKYSDKAATAIVTLTATGGSGHSVSQSIQVAAKVEEVTEEPVTIVTRAATPTAVPAGGAVESGRTVTLDTATSGATIYYTTDGTTPSSSNGTEYTYPIYITSAKTIKAVAVKSGKRASSVMEESYTLRAPEITDYNVGQGHADNSVSIIFSPGANHSVRIAVQSDAFDWPSVGYNASSKDSYTPGADIANSVGKHIGVYEVDENGLVVKFADVIVDLSQQPGDSDIVASLSQINSGNLSSFNISFNPSPGADVTSITDVNDLITSIVINPDTDPVTVDLSSATLMWDGGIGGGGGGGGIPGGGFPGGGGPGGSSMVMIMLGNDPAIQVHGGDIVRVTFANGIESCSASVVEVG
ncbi:S-layer homology domain-containing protein [Paenibacillus albus]|uniref:SLH domain-containing protein n=1 Tax=Paenibacillus albus TaxID=2495582 RepID=A0A3Q8X4G4_9BACL|nr:S-layer homology domain-containing protein [Paenibacillus albus]AZN39023.1 hypothetical protein EJC50_04580 [Paenibacillus albus]